MTCSLVALSLIAKWMIKSSFCCLSLLASHHQCLTLLWPWSSVSSHTLNAGCLVPIGGFQLLLACFACLVRWCPPGSYVCVVVVMVDFVSGGSHIYVNVRLPSRSRGSSTLWSICDTVDIIVFVQTCHNTYCEVLFSSSLLVAQTLLIFSTQIHINLKGAYTEQGECSFHYPPSLFF